MFELLERKRIINTIENKIIVVSKNLLLLPNILFIAYITIDKNTKNTAFPVELNIIMLIIAKIDTSKKIFLVFISLIEMLIGNKNGLKLSVLGQKKY